MFARRATWSIRKNIEGAWLAEPALASSNIQPVMMRASQVTSACV